MADNNTDLFSMDLNNISLEDLGSSLLARQKQKNDRRAKEIKKQENWTKALAVLGAGQAVFKGALKNRLKEIDELQLFELSNNEEQHKRVRGMANLMQNFDEEDLIELAKNNGQDWATMSTEEKTKLYLNSPYAALLEQSLKQPIDLAIDQANIFSDVQTIKDDTNLYNNAKDTALQNIVNYYLDGNKYKEFDAEINKLYDSPDGEFLTRAEKLERAMSLTVHDLTQMEKSYFNRQKENYRNIGVWDGIKDAFEKVGWKNEEEGGINLFKNIDSNYGLRMDEILGNLDIQGTLTNSMRDFMVETREADTFHVKRATEDTDGQDTMEGLIDRIAINQGSRHLYTQDSPEGELYQMMGYRGRVEHFMDDIRVNDIQMGLLRRDSLAVYNLLEDNPELAEQLYVANYERLYGKIITTEDLEKWRKLWNTADADVYRKQFAVLVTTNEGFNQRQEEDFWANNGKNGWHWYKVDWVPGQPESYSSTGIVNQIKDSVNYNTNGGILPMLRNDGILTPSETEDGSFSVDENWEEIGFPNQRVAIATQVNAIIGSELPVGEKDALLEDLFANVPNPDNLTLEEFLVEGGYTTWDSIFRDMEVPVTLREWREDSRSKSSIQKELTERRKFMDFYNLEEDKKFKLLRSQLKNNPEDIDPIFEDPAIAELLEVLYEREGLGSRKGPLGLLNIGRDNTRVYEDSEGHLTAGIGHKLVGDELKRYKVGDEVPVDVIVGWLVNDIKTYREVAIRNLKEKRPDLLDNPEAVNMFTNFYYQLGEAGGNKFEQMWKAIERGDFVQAANEALYNYENGKRTGKTTWHNQTKSRAEFFADFLRQL